MMKTTANTPGHSRGPLGIFEEKDHTGNYHKIGTIRPSKAHYCAGTYGNPPLKLLCERHARALGYIW